jgi:hypothetical protein
MDDGMEALAAAHGQNIPAPDDPNPVGHRQGIATALDIGLDRKALDAQQSDKRLGSGFGSHKLTAGELTAKEHPSTGEFVAKAGHGQPADGDAAVPLARRQTDKLVPSRLGFLQKAGDDTLVGAAQAADRHPVAGAEIANGFQAAGVDFLAQNFDFPAVDILDRADDFMDDGNLPGAPAFAVLPRDKAGDLADSHLRDIGLDAVDRDLDGRRIGDALAVDIDAAETPDGSDESRAADAIVEFETEARAANAIVFLWLRRKGAAADRTGQKRQEAPSARKGWRGQESAPSAGLAGTA